MERDLDYAFCKSIGSIGNRNSASVLTIVPKKKKKNEIHIERRSMPGIVNIFGWIIYTA